MVVKAATKKKLMDLGCPEIMAHKWADDRKWGIIVLMNFDDIMSIFSKRPQYIYPKGVVREKDIYDIVREIRENELNRLHNNPPAWTKKEFYGFRDDLREEYIKKVEAFGMIPVGSRYSYLRVDSQNFMNWINENPFEVKQ